MATRDVPYRFRKRLSTPRLRKIVCSFLVPRIIEGKVIIADGEPHYRLLRCIAKAASELREHIEPAVTIVVERRSENATEQACEERMSAALEFQALAEQATRKN